MLPPIYITKQFEKNLKRTRRRGKNLDKFKMIARSLLTVKVLDPIHHDHQLSGNYIWAMGLSHTSNLTRY